MSSRLKSALASLRVNCTVAVSCCASTVLLVVIVMVGGVLSVGVGLVDVLPVELVEPVGVGVPVDTVALLVLWVWVLVALVVPEPLFDVLPVVVLPVLMAGGMGGVGGMTGVKGVLRLMPMDSTLSISPPSWFKLPAASPKRSLDTNTSALVLLELGVNKAV